MKIIPHTNRSYLEALADHIVVFDGAMGTSVQACQLGPIDFGGETLNGCNDYLVITRPAVVESIHASFLAAGAEAIETDTFRSTGSRCANTACRIASSRSIKRRPQWRAVPPIDLHATPVCLASWQAPSVRVVCSPRQTIPH